MTQIQLNFPALLSICVVILCLVIFNFENRYNISGNFIGRFNHEPSWSGFASKISGAVVFGLIPVSLLVPLTGLEPVDYGFSAGNIREYKAAFTIVLISIVMLTWLASTLKNIRRHMRVNVNDPKPVNIVLNAAGWAIYLFGYELMFRGVLWFTCYKAFGFMPALIINLVLYSLAHYNQGLLQSFGAIPAGILFCILAHAGGSFILPFLAHTTLAVSFDVFSFMQKYGLRLKSEIKNDT